MFALNQQTLAKSGATNRPPTLEKGNYIAWESQLRRFLGNKGEDKERTWINKRQMQSKEGKVDSSKALDASLVVTKCSAIVSENSNSEHAFNKSVNESSRIDTGKQDTSRSSGNYLTHAVDADIRPANDQVPFAEVDSNTTPDSTHMSHRGGEIDQDAEQYQIKCPLLNAELFKTKDMVEKEVYNELSNRFLQLENHCISLEISIQQKKKSFQSNKPSLKNELRKLKGNSMDTKFAKPSILGKPILQPPRNQLVVRQPNAFKSKRPNFLKPRFASQVDVNNVLSKPVTPHYLPKVQEYVLAKPHHKCVFNANHDDFVTKFMKEDSCKIFHIQHPLSHQQRMTEIHLFQPMFDEYFKPPPNVDHPVPEVPTLVPAASTSSPSLTIVDQDAQSTSTSKTTSEQQSLVIPQGVKDDFYDIKGAHMDNDPYFDCDELNSAKIALMTNLSHYGFDNLAEVNNHDNRANYLTHQEMQVSSISEQSSILTQSNTESTSDSNIISYSQYMNESQYNIVQNSTIPALQDDLILSVIEQLKTQVVTCTKINQDNKHVNELLMAELE
nr:hypothetical protein [Tanacetum cinerariifolium]